MDPQTSKSFASKQEGYAKQWFASLARYHRIAQPTTWEFTEQDVIAFLRSKLKQQMPTWKRLKIVEGLIWYRNHVRQATTPPLEPIRTILRDLVARERNDQAEAPITEVVGRIDPREPDVIQAMRRTLRLHRRSLNTEKAYVQKVRGFMAERGLKCLADFQGVGAQDVEAHLTDLAVDGNVAPSTQDQAFYSLLFLFEHVLKRELGTINAIRAAATKRVPTSGYDCRTSPASDSPGRYREACHVPYLSPFLCDPFASSWDRHSHHSGITGAQRHFDDDDLYPRVGSTRYPHR